MSQSDVAAEMRRLQIAPVVQRFGEQPVPEAREVAPIGGNGFRRVATLIGEVGEESVQGLVEQGAGIRRIRQDVQPRSSRR